VIPFTISVPADASAGKYRAGILLELADLDTSRPDDAPEGQIYVAVNFRKALNLRVIVPGPTAADFDIASVEHVFDSGQSIFRVELRNRGNVSVDVAGGRLEVKNASGDVIGAQPIRMSGKFLAWDAVVYEVAFDRPLPEGQYAVAVTMDYGGDAPATWESTFEVAREAAHQAEQEAIDRGFTLPTQPSQKPSYLVYIASGLLVVLVGVGLAWFVAAQARRGTARRNEQEDRDR